MIQLLGNLACIKNSKVKKYIFRPPKDTSKIPIYIENSKKDFIFTLKKVEKYIHPGSLERLYFKKLKHIYIFQFDRLSIANKVSLLIQVLGGSIYIKDYKIKKYISKPLKETLKGSVYIKNFEKDFTFILKKIKNIYLGF